MPFLKSLVWLDLGLNPGLPDHWRTLYPLGQWNLLRATCSVTAHITQHPFSASCFRFPFFTPKKSMFRAFHVCSGMTGPAMCTVLLSMCSAHDLELSSMHMLHAHSGLLIGILPHCLSVLCQYSYQCSWHSCSLSFAVINSRIVRNHIEPKRVK